MFATRDQENLIHGHQTTAAAKPLNQGVRGIAPKTPGPNGTSRVNFGNNQHTTRKPFKDDENTIFNGGKKGNNTDKQTFITPLAPRERAPLGAKTVNAKGQGLKTPAPGLQKTQKRTTSARKTRLRIHQPDPISVEPTTKSLQVEDNIPDIEYCPPQAIPLPDLPDDPFIFTDDYTSPLLEPHNILAGTFNHYSDPDNELESDGRTRRQRLADEADALYMAQRDEQCDIQAEMMILGINAAPKALVKEDAAPRRGLLRKQKPTGPSSSDAKRAVLALSLQPQATPVPHFAAPTAATRAKSTTTSLAPSGSASPRTSAASRATIGYSAGRKVSAGLRPQLPETKLKNVSTETVKARMHQRFSASPIRELLGSTQHGSRVDEAEEDDGDDPFGISIEDIRLSWDENEEVIQLDPELFR